MLYALAVAVDKCSHTNDSVTIFTSYPFKFTLSDGFIFYVHPALDEEYTMKAMGASRPHPSPQHTHTQKHLLVVPTLFVLAHVTLITVVVMVAL